MQLGALVENAVVLAEPVSKNTAPAIALATKYIMQKSNSDPVILVVPSDHLIEDADKFSSTVKKGKELAEQGYIVTFGIEPAYPETGYGYINTLEKIENGYKVKEFVEKPDLETAEKYLAAGTYFWNSGIFMFKASTMIEEIENILLILLKFLIMLILIKHMTYRLLNLIKCLIFLLTMQSWKSQIELRLQNLKATGMI